MKVYFYIGGGVVVIVLVFLFTIFPAWYPIRLFEPIFYGACDKILHGELDHVQKTDFVGLSGKPVREDYLQCGVDLAFDANRICYVVPAQELSYGDNSLGQEIADDCNYCQYGAEKIKIDNKVVGKQCRPFRVLWRWVYDSNF